jgi:hypothetical protein
VAYAGNVDLDEGIIHVTQRVLLGQHFGFNVRYAELGRDGLGRGAVVAGQHYNANPVGLKVLKRRRSRCLDRIGHRDDTRRSAVMTQLPLRGIG